MQRSCLFLPNIFTTCFLTLKSFFGANLPSFETNKPWQAQAHLNQLFRVFPQVLSFETPQVS